jgi:hypothetical protein
MINALIKRVSVTYKCYEMYVHRGEKRYNCSCFEIDQEMDAILNENYHRFIISLQVNNLTSLSLYTTDLTSDR